LSLATLDNRVARLYHYAAMKKPCCNLCVLRRPFRRPGRLIPEGGLGVSHT
jgi:hypothetical protein